MANESVVGPDLGQIKRHLQDAAEIGTLLLWIESARSLIGRIEYLGRNSSAFAEVARKYQVQINSATWDQDESDALTKLILLMHTSMYRAEALADGEGVQHV